MQRLAWLLLPLAVASGAAAQEATPDMLDAEARARFELAMVHIEQGRFEDAATEFHQAWELSHRDALLYNEFLAWRDGGFNAQAAEALAAYLDSLPADDPNRPNLEARLRALRAQLDAAPATEDATDDAIEPSREPEPTTSPHPIGFVLLGVGAAAAIAGAVLGGVALSISDGLAADCAGGVCPESRRGDLDTGPALALGADILLPVGAVTAVVGLILALTVTEASTEATAALACDGSGCVGAVGGSF